MPLGILRELKPVPKEPVIWIKPPSKLKQESL
jgi:hypothetical protein